MDKGKVVTGLLGLFVAFIILQDASSAGTTANRFFGWLFDGVGVAGEFIASVFGGDDASGTTFADETTFPSSPVPTVTVTETMTEAPSGGTDGG